MVERPLRMREAPGSNPGISIAFFKRLVEAGTKGKKTVGSSGI